MRVRMNGNDRFDEYYSEDNWRGGRPGRDFSGNRNAYGKWDHKTHYYEFYTTGGRGLKECTFDFLKKNFDVKAAPKFADGEFYFIANRGEREMVILSFPSAGVIYNHMTSSYTYITPYGEVPMDSCFKTADDAMRWIRKNEDAARGEIVAIKTKEQVAAEDAARHGHVNFSPDGPGTFSFTF